MVKNTSFLEAFKARPDGGFEQPGLVRGVPAIAGVGILS